MSLSVAGRRVRGHGALGSGEMRTVQVANRRSRQIPIGHLEAGVQGGLSSSDLSGEDAAHRPLAEDARIDVRKSFMMCLQESEAVGCWRGGIPRRAGEMSCCRIAW